MKSIVMGIVAHVDAGKTTLSEALLYNAGTVRQLGRVDHGSAFLDSDALERARGITIFSHQAMLTTPDLQVTLLDTPGHVDFASQTEQVLSVLDYAVLVVSAPAGVQGHTRTLWRLLARYQVPTVIFVNKMDAPGVDQAQVLAELQAAFGDGVLPLPTGPLTDAVAETIALQDEAVLEDYLNTQALPDATVQRLIQARRVFPVFFGAALKNQGVAELLAGLTRWVVTRPAEATLAGRVFKITHTAKGERLSWVRLTGGTLTPRQQLGAEKIGELRVYNGPKATVVPALTAGMVGALVGLRDTVAGQGLGTTLALPAPVLTPVLSYALVPGEVDVQACLHALQELAEEDPQLNVSWSAQLQEIRVALMGPIQLAVLTQLLATRFGLAVTFGPGHIRYRETLTAPVEGVGHFEPLRHYAEVHLMLTPAAAGSGVRWTSTCAYEVLDRNWQSQVLASLAAKPHLGVLIGAPLTDVTITLVSGRASIKHSVGGDFREATWRAVRQGLMMAKAAGHAQLLEPWYQFRLTVGATQIGRAMTDIQAMGGQFDAPVEASGLTVLTGTAPVAGLQNYAQAVGAYTHGQGTLECTVAGYQPCHDAAAVIEAAAYAPTADLPNTPDSVFCAHGAGYPVAWDQVPAAAHVPYQAG
ncbi:elongation factor G [Lacticaseibacillus daqingensis]|uniref:elongation factor G n=1 Tax=Lacticaseibacillus daqingensis TaxID=2486014 RepID=UPI000F795490|nr:TetM/TetW/TetO/TetS family tetracycline resistance ribosomal protection protein [Lacticaseibacillus daqingensis]